MGGEGWAELVQIEATFREMFSSPYRVGNCSSQTVKGDILHKGLEDSERHGFWHLLSHPDSYSSRIDCVSLGEALVSQPR